ncbi:MAG: hypothetical protein WCT04_09000 [Planctomycetota bacterium]
MGLYFKLCAVACVMAFATQTLHAEDADTLSSKYFELAADEKNDAECKKIGASFLEAAKTDADGLNEFAWKVMTEDGIKKRDLDLAMRVAKAAFDLSEGKNAAIVDTYARAFFDAGKHEEGIKWQKKAIEVCTDDGLKSELEETLKSYITKAAEKKDAKK